MEDRSFLTNNHPTDGISVFAGNFMLSFISCEKHVTNAKIKIVETDITRLEKNYGNMTRAEKV